MEVDKRQGREKHTKSGTKEGLRTGVRTSGETNSRAGWPSLNRADSGRGEKTH